MRDIYQKSCVGCSLINGTHECSAAVDRHDVQRNDINTPAPVSFDLACFAGFESIFMWFY